LAALAAGGVGPTGGAPVPRRLPVDVQTVRSRSLGQGTWMISCVARHAPMHCYSINIQPSNSRTLFAMCQLSADARACFYTMYGTCYVLGTTSTVALSPSAQLARGRNSSSASRLVIGCSNGCILVQNRARLLQGWNVKGIGRHGLVAMALLASNSMVAISFLTTIWSVCILADIPSISHFVPSTP
jgi:hypothetical protein